MGHSEKKSIIYITEVPKGEEIRAEAIFEVIIATDCPRKDFGKVRTAKIQKKIKKLKTEWYKLNGTSLRIEGKMKFSGSFMEMILELQNQTYLESPKEDHDRILTKIWPLHLYMEVLVFQCLFSLHWPRVDSSLSVITASWLAKISSPL